MNLKKKAMNKLDYLNNKKTHTDLQIKKYSLAFIDTNPIHIPFLQHHFVTYNEHLDHYQYMNYFESFAFY